MQVEPTVGNQGKDTQGQAIGNDSRASDIMDGIFGRIFRNLCNILNTLKETVIRKKLVTPASIDTTVTFYSWIYNRYSWISIHVTHRTNQYFLSIVLFTYSIGGIINGNET
jgi:hypothetical protein